MSKPAKTQRKYLIVFSLLLLLVFVFWPSGKESQHVECGSLAFCAFTERDITSQHFGLPAQYVTYEQYYDDGQNSDSSHIDFSTINFAFNIFIWSAIVLPFALIVNRKN